MSFRNKTVPIEGSEIYETQTLAVPLLFVVPNSLSPIWYIECQTEEVFEVGKYLCLESLSRLALVLA